MKLSHLATIDCIISVICVVIALPAILIVHALRIAEKPFRWIIEKWSYFHFSIVNGLIKYADEVKDGTIANPHYIRNYTAKQLYYLLMGEKEESK